MQCAQRPFHDEGPETAGEGRRGVAALARRIRHRDAAAEGQLVARFRGPLETLLRRQVHDSALAEDLCHEVFAIALPALREGRLREDDRLAGYLWGIARHVARRARQRRARERRGPTTASDLVDRRPTPETTLLDQERARLLRVAIAELSERDREVLTAFYLVDEPKDVICRRLGLSSPQFDVVKHRAVKRLAAAWGAREQA